MDGLQRVCLVEGRLSSPGSPAWLGNWLVLALPLLPKLGGPLRLLGLSLLTWRGGPQ